MNLGVETIEGEARVRAKAPPSLITTKIQRPHVPAGLIDRPRLLALLPAVSAKLLTVVKAPAGFGKTSIAAVWAEHLYATDSKVAWVGLDPDDDVPTRVLYYAAQALQRACDGLGSSVIEMISEMSLLPIETAISTLINELAELDDDIHIFLDDYHFIADPAAHDAMFFFLRHVSSNVHVVITTRTDPPLPLARLRAQNQLLEVDASELRFDLAETQRFFEREHVGSLNDSDVKALHSTTEGWPAALRLVASASANESGGVKSYVRSLRGVARPIGDYIEDTLATFPPEMIQFMFRTSILDCLNAPLCNAVMGDAASKDALAKVANCQLLSPMGNDGYWFRYHPLLAEFLRKRLQDLYGSEIPELHRRAAAWFAANGLWTEAVTHAIAAGETQQALGWIEKCAMAMVKRGDLLTLLGWQRQFPKEMMRGQLNIRLAFAWGMALAMRFDDALALLAEIGPEVAGLRAPAREDMAIECQTIRCVAVALQDDSSAALALALPCVQKRTADPWNNNVASNVARFGYAKAGNLEAFYAVPWLPYSEEDDHRNLLSHVYRLSLQGGAEFQQLRVAVAERHLLEALQKSEQYVGPQSTAAALPACLIALVRYEQGRLDEAEALIGDRLPTISATVMLECVLTAYVVLVRIAASRSNIERAYSLLEQAGNLGYARHWGRLIAAMQVERLRLYLSEGRMAEAAACVTRLDHLVAEYPVSGRCAWSEIAVYRMLANAHLALAKGSPQDAVTILRMAREDPQFNSRTYFGLRVDTLLAVALLDAGEPVKAMEIFQGVMSVAAPAGISRTILDTGPEIGLLLPRARENAERKVESAAQLLPYLDTLQESWRSLHQSDPAHGRSREISEALTPREHGILELIAQGKSNKEIARTLGIAPETVKSHLKNIFTKLGAEKRTQAVSRAQSLGLVRN